MKRIQTAQARDAVVPHRRPNPFIRIPFRETALVVVGVTVSVLLAALTVVNPGHALGALLVATAVLFCGLACPGLIILVMVTVTVVHPGVWSQLGTPWGGSVHFGDALLVLVCVTALIRCRHMPRGSVLKILGLFLLFGVVRSVVADDGDGMSSFLRLMQPVVAGAVVGLSFPRDFDPWRWVRWGLLGVLATVPLFGSTVSRWSGLPGGPNEVALVAAVLVILGAAESNKATRALFVVCGLAGLLGARGIGATAGALAGLAVLTAGRRMRQRNAGATPGISLPVFICAVSFAVVVIPKVRTDTSVTLHVHTTQAHSFWDAFTAGNPLVGNGWSHVDPAALVNSYRATNIQGLHNVYLDMAVYLGAVGLVLFLAVLWLVWRSGDLVTRGVLMATAVWFNTTGAYPCAGWGMLGLTVAAVLWRIPGPQGEKTAVLGSPRDASSSATARLGGCAPVHTHPTVRRGTLSDGGCRGAGH